VEVLVTTLIVFRLGGQKTAYNIRFGIINWIGTILKEKNN
jgi:hypothetical protein